MNFKCSISNFKYLLWTYVHLVYIHIFYLSYEDFVLHSFVNMVIWLVLICILHLSDIVVFISHNVQENWIFMKTCLFGFIFKAIKPKGASQHEHEIKLAISVKTRHLGKIISRLILHIESRHGAVLYYCDKCDFKTTLYWNLRIHQQSKHGAIW